MGHLEVTKSAQGWASARLGLWLYGYDLVCDIPTKVDPTYADYAGASG